MKSLRVRIFVYIASLILVFAGAVMLLNWTCLTAFYFSHGNSVLKSAVTQMKQSLPEELDYNTDAFVDIEEANNLEIVIYKSNGEAVYATPLREFDPSADDPQSLRYRLEQMMGADIVRQEYDTSSSRFEVQRSRDGSLNYLAYRAQVTEDLWTVVRINSDMLRNSASVANTFMLITVAFILVLAVMVSAIIASHLSKPIRQMNRTTRAMSRFDFSHKLKIRGKDEIAQLSQSINTLSDNTSQLLKELNEKNARLEKEVERERALEKMRKEFVSNVSHELKTPIAIIQGYAEGLRLNVADDEERRQMYCDIIESESYKMDRLVKQLLELSRLESGQETIRQSEFNLTDMAVETVERIASITDDVKVERLFDDTPRIAVAEEMRMDQVLTNYLNNAIAHAKGENRVTVSIEEREDCYRVSVFNTGDSIPEETMEKVWISFYRADKSRSRENGNSGLGLSIVSNIMKLHNQDYGVYNEENGVVFWFDVKKYEE